VARSSPKCTRCYCGICWGTRARWICRRNWICDLRNLDLSKYVFFFSYFMEQSLHAAEFSRINLRHNGARVSRDHINKIRSGVGINHDIWRARIWNRRHRGIINHWARSRVSRFLRICRRASVWCTEIRTCVSSRVDEIVALIKAGALGPWMQSKFVAAAEDRARYLSTAQRCERSTGITIMYLRGIGRFKSEIGNGESIFQGLWSLTRILQTRVTRILANG